MTKLLTEDIMQQAFAMVNQAPQQKTISIVCASEENAILVNIYQAWMRQASPAERQQMHQLFAADENQAVKQLIAWADEQVAEGSEKSLLGLFEPVEKSK